MDRGVWRATVQGVAKESDMTEQACVVSSSTHRQTTIILCSYHNDLTSPISLSSLKAEMGVGVGVSGCPGLGHGFDSKMNRKVTFSFFVTLKNSSCACTDKQSSQAVFMAIY